MDSNVPSSGPPSTRLKFSVLHLCVLKLAHTKFAPAICVAGNVHQSN